MTAEPVRGPGSTDVVRPESSSSDVQTAPAVSKGMLLVAGVVAIVLGAVAILVPALASVGTAIFIGWLLLVASVASVIDAFAIREWGRSGLRLLVAVVTFATGLSLIAAPLRGVLTLTVILLLWFVAQGIAHLAAGVANRQAPGAGLTVVSGVISLALGVLLALQLPASATWAIGLLVGINLLSHGFAALVLAAQVGSAAGGTPRPVEASASGA